jgi:hypothetical protein
VSATPRTFRTKKATRMVPGIGAAFRARAGSITPEKSVSTANATNHGIDASTLKKNSVPNAATMAHRLTALEATYPPRLHCRRKGSSVMSNAWVNRKNP